MENNIQPIVVTCIDCSRRAKEGDTVFCISEYLDPNTGEVLKGINHAFRYSAEDLKAIYDRNNTSKTVFAWAIQKALECEVDYYLYKEYDITSNGCAFTRAEWNVFINKTWEKFSNEK